MKGLRTPVVLAAVAAVLGGYIFLVERKSDTTEEAARDARKVARGFERDKVTHVELWRGTDKIILDKTGDHWRITSPIQFGADSGAVDDLLSGIEFLEQKRTIDGKLADYGLDPPRLTVRAGTVALLLGSKEDALGKSVYVARQGEPRVYVVDKHFRDQVDKTVDELRDRRALPFDRSALQSLAVGPLHLRKQKSTWLLADGTRADATLVGDVLKALEELRVASWKASGSRSASALEIEADGKHGFVDPTTPCGTGDQVLGGGEVAFCVKKDDARKLAELASKDFRDRRLVSVKADEVKAITIESGGKKLALARDEGGWKIQEQKAQAAEDEAVRKWIDGLGEFRALGFARADSTALPITVTLELESGGREQLHIGEPQGGKRKVRRNDEPVLLEVHAELGNQVTPDPLLFRSRHMLSFVRFDAKKLVAREQGMEEVAEKGEGDVWKLKSPVALDADADVMDKLLGALGDLRAEKFGTAPFAAERTLVVTIEPPASGKDKPKSETHTIELGAHCSARVDGGTPFVVAKEPCSELRAHLAPRKLLTLAEDKLSGFEIDRGGKKEIAEKRGPTWYTGSAPVEQSKIDAFVSLLRGLSASDAIGYGPEKSAQRPHLGIRIKTYGQSDTTLTVSADGHARVSGRDVTYQLSKDTVAQLDKTSFAPDKSASN